MSNVLKALKKSEQGYKALQNAQAIHDRYEPVKIKKESNINWVMLALFLLPCLILVSILLFSEHQQKPTQPIEIVKDSIELPYPNLGELKDLPPPPPKSVVVVNASEVKFDQYVSDLNSQRNAQIEAESQASSTSSKPTEPYIYHPDGAPQKTTANTPTNDKGFNVENIDLSSISPELAARFQSAVNNSKPQQSVKNTSASDFEHPVVNLVGNEDQFKRKLPAMNLETHIYTSKAGQEPWVKINGQNLKEKDWIPNSDVRLEKILPGSLIVYFDSKYIQIPALYEWKG